MPATLNINLQPSRYLLAGLIALHAVTLTTIGWLAVPIWCKCLLLLAVLVSLRHYSVAHALLRSPHSIMALQFNTQWQARLTDRKQHVVEAQLLGNSFVSLGMVLLNFKIEGQRRKKTVVIFADAINSEQFRRLRVFLKYGGKGS